MEHEGLVGLVAAAGDAVGEVVAFDAPHGLGVVVGVVGVVSVLVVGGRVVGAVI